MAVGAVGRNRATEAFFEGTALGQFLIKHCMNCGHHSSPQAAQCEVCGATDLADVAASGEATLVSWAVTHTKGANGAEVRTVVAIAQLAEGPWWWSQLIGVEADELHAGEPLTITFEAADGGEAVPVFSRV
jgi:uncharacterized OB-fold protein